MTRRLPVTFDDLRAAVALAHPTWSPDAVIRETGSGSILAEALSEVEEEEASEEELRERTLFAYRVEEALEAAGIQPPDSPDLSRAIDEAYEAGMTPERAAEEVAALCDLPVNSRWTQG